MVVQLRTSVVKPRSTGHSRVWVNDSQQQFWFSCRVNISQLGQPVQSRLSSGLFSGSFQPGFGSIHVGSSFGSRFGRASVGSTEVNGWSAVILVRVRFDVRVTSVFRPPKLAHSSTLG
ncbi:hypothetical protein HanRHA438_Chr07g0305881 [Helianthus annuus]|uniref:Uncharacterized protein n=1 Tax=Helianthus annuus TaxID=4232 RepID=A0A9K3NFU2_HELAN|nr:hypothetical protein HanXRQr2_Chr07g0295581 [Helianthus annuus]KAJ0556903.1 hypothetical protein HanIR_Chr07g0319061 [Helianthus annuus]KAJ0904774.1 hypothetical protein HanPSC8_Chr07g0286151 [Helianthus annuus]KAJ0908032.1 hypothetical protein HanRHA438_Chr07g0305881 [Helianthus annuus]